MDTAQIIFAVALPIALMVVPLTAILAQHKRKVLELELAARNKADKDSASHEELEERMRILERIVTDKGYEVSEQIKALEDTRPLATPLQQKENV